MRIEHYEAAAAPKDAQAVRQLQLINVRRAVRAADSSKVYIGALAARLER